MIKYILVDKSTEYKVYRIVKNNVYLSWKDVFMMVEQNDKFVISFIQILESNQFATYYLEFVPVSKDNFDEILFEFVLIKTHGFEKDANITSFGEDKLDTNSNKIISFPNLSKTCVLICPCFNHQIDINRYIHIGTFINSSNINQEQKVLLLSRAFNVYSDLLDKLPGQKLWLSTHGKGVAWLHIRVDLIPKYISWNKYK